MLEWQEEPAQQNGCLRDCFTLDAAGGAIHTTRPLLPLGLLQSHVRNKIDC